MLHYLIVVTEDLLIAVTLLCLLYGQCVNGWKRLDRTILLSGMGLGLAASVVMSVLKNTTSKIATNRWNFWIFAFTFFATLLFLMAAVISRKRKGRAILTSALAGLLAALLIFYELPDVLAYPLHFKVGDRGVLSIEFLVRLTGLIAALILLWIYCRNLYRSLRALDSPGWSFAVLTAASLVNALRCLGQMLRPWVTNASFLPDFFPRYTSSGYPWAFPVVRFVANNTLFFVCLVMGAALLIPLLAYLSHLRISRAYSNPAQLRRLKADNRAARHAAVKSFTCCVIFILILTVGYAYDNKAIELSEPEPYTVQNGKVIVALKQVDDGKLHRFEYETENKVKVRWIVIRKPNSASYGVGLDACEICGSAGYYQRGEQVICKRCDVVMNINTIGFKGGCNPIPLAYSVMGGQMIFDLEDIRAGEKEFK